MVEARRRPFPTLAVAPMIDVTERHSRMLIRCISPLPVVYSEMTWDRAILYNAPGEPEHEQGQEPEPLPETEPELSSRPASVEESVLREVFKRIDRNGDGALTRAEIILRLRKDEELASLLQLPQKLLDDDRSA